MHRTTKITDAQLSSAKTAKAVREIKKLTTRMKEQGELREHVNNVLEILFLEQAEDTASDDLLWVYQQELAMACGRSAEEAAATAPDLASSLIQLGHPHGMKAMLNAISKCMLVRLVS